LNSEFAAPAGFEDPGDEGIDRLAGKPAAVDLEEDEPLYVEPAPSASYHRMRSQSEVQSQYGADAEAVSDRESPFETARLEPGLGDIDTALSEPAYRRTRIEPTLGDTNEVVEEADARRSPAAAPTVNNGSEDAGRAARSKPPASRKIVTLRLAAPAQQRYEGRQLRQLLESQSLEHGRYGIFHRSCEGASVFSAASMTEPGTFDLAAMDQERYAGITMFMLLPGPVEGVEAFTRMAECAVHVERSLGGLLQDDRGQPFNELRFNALREEIVRFQHAFPAPEPHATH
jgi:cell division protein ZipA